MSKSDAVHQRENDLKASRDMDIDTLARTLWGEARGEAPQGRIAVANVVMNRLKAKKAHWGRTVTDVCMKPWQFSCWNFDDPNRAKLLSIGPSNHVFAECLQIAQKAVDGDLPDTTSGSTHYHTKAVSPSWAPKLVQTAEIGNHLFYWEA